MNSGTKQSENAAGLLLEYPLTQGQAALWFHHNLSPTSVAYNLAGAVAVPADTDLDEKISIGKIPSVHLLLEHKEIV